MRAAATGLAVLLASVPGCGGGESEPANPNDKVLNCIRDEDLDAQKVRNDVVQIDAEQTGPRIVFFRTVAEAEGKDFTGAAPGAEQVGRALVYANEGSDDVLKKVEDCIHDEG
jgi:hypothetical protein